MLALSLQLKANFKSMGEIKILSIGDVAEKAGMNASTLRFYEQIGLIPSPLRKSGKRIYDERVIGRLRFIKLAQSAGFHIDEIKMLLEGFDSNIPPSERWRVMAVKKHQELVEKQNQISLMQSVLQASLHCNCLSWDECFHTIQTDKMR